MPRKDVKQRPCCTTVPRLAHSVSWGTFLPGCPEGDAPHDFSTCPWIFVHREKTHVETFQPQMAPLGGKWHRFTIAACLEPHAWDPAGQQNNKQNGQQATWTQTWTGWEKGPPTGLSSCLEEGRVPVSQKVLRKCQLNVASTVTEN